jgi:hypothetical protein
MPEQTQARQRLAAAMDERRLELGMRWQDVAAAGGVSLRAINNARTGDKDIRPLTRHGIEKGLEWAPGTIGRILSGRRAPREPLPEAPPLAHEDAALQAILDDDRLPLEVRRGMVALAEAMRRRSDSERDGRSALRALPLHGHQAQRHLGRVRGAPVGGHHRERVPVGGHLRLEHPEPALGFPFPCRPGRSPQGVPQGSHPSRPPSRLPPAPAEKGR